MRRFVLVPLALERFQERNNCVDFRGAETERLHLDVEVRVLVPSAVVQLNHLMQGADRAVMLIGWMPGHVA